MIKLIESVGESFDTVNHSISIDLKIRYLNQLMEIGYFAVDLGKYDSKCNDIIENSHLLDKKNTKISVIVETKNHFLQVSKNQLIDLIEIPFTLLKEIKEIPLLKEKIIVNFSLDIKTLSGSDFANINQALDYCKQNQIKKIKFYNLCKELNEKQIKILFENLINKYTEFEFIPHFYIKEKYYKIIFDILYLTGIHCFDVNIRGFGRNNLGNIIPTEKMITYLMEKKEKIEINTLALESAYNTSKKIFSES